MDESFELLSQDLRILEAMLAELEAYLASDATHWPMHREGMPKLTIGGCLMRLARLRTMRHRLTRAEQIRLDEAEQAFEKLASENVVRFERRSHDELHARLREWTTYLRNTSSQAVRERSYYANTVDARIVIMALSDKLQMPPYQIDPQVLADVGRMDNYLKGLWQEGEFVLPAMWKEAYPARNYWWLYGNP
jgi:hypothetical protein